MDAGDAVAEADTESGAPAAVEVQEGELYSPGTPLVKLLGLINQLITGGPHIVRIHKNRGFRWGTQ